MRINGYHCAPALLITLLILHAGVRYSAAQTANPPTHQWDHQKGTLIKLFDFEERKRGNFEDMPMNWYRVKSSAYPSYNPIGFDKTQRTSGEHSFKLSLNGGSAGAYLEKAVIPIQPEAEYRIQTMIRTENVVHARARIIAFYLKQDGTPILESLTSSNPTISNNTWSKLNIEIKGRYPDAAWLMLRLQLVQPQIWRKQNLNDLRIPREDLKASAWFDDIAIYQMPYIYLSSQHPTNIIRAPQTPTLQFNVKDHSGSKLKSHVRVYNIHRQLIDEQVRQLDRHHPSRWTWTPRLKTFGWYYADLTVSNDSGVVAKGVTAFGYLPEPHAISDQDRAQFELNLEQTKGKHTDINAQLIERVNIGALALPVWWAEMNHAQLESPIKQADPFINSMLLQNRRVSLVFNEVPAVLDPTQNLSADQPLRIFNTQYQLVQPYLKAMLVRYGQMVNRYQIGHSQLTEAIANPQSTQLTDLHKTFDAFLADPVIILPWSAYQTLPEQTNPRYAYRMLISPSIPVDALNQYSESWGKHTEKMTIQLEVLPVGSYTHHERVTDLALRMIHAWQINPHTISLTQPWTVIGEREAQVVPDPTLPVWSNVSDMLAGRQFFGQLRQEPGLEVHILDGARGGVLVGWRTHHPTGEFKLHHSLCDQPVMTDIFGNRTPLEQSGEDYILPLTNQPVFVEGVNTRLMRFPARFRIEPDFAEAAIKFHEHHLVIENPWDVTLTGTVHMIGPDRWKYQPGFQRFTIDAGETLKLPVAFNFPLSETGGLKSIPVKFDLEADRQYELTAQAQLTIGLKNIEFHSLPEIEENKQTGELDLVIVNRITNRSQREISMYTYARIPNHPKRERVVLSLKPGATIVKEFRFPNAAKELSGQTGRSGVREINGASILNHDIRIP